jgi:ectoine hydroxylase-related dioxygenase (phytanoyl-CoA dioxygenase family)
LSDEGLRITSRERTAWEEDGFFLRLRVFSPHEVEVLAEAAESVASRAARAAQASADRYHIDGNEYVEATGSTVQYEHRARSRTLRVVEPFHPLDVRFESLIDDARLVEPMKDLVGSERVALFTDKLNLKRPREGSRFRWHQDSPYWAHEIPHVDQLPNVMVALDDADERNGCLRVVRGSHRKGMLPGLEGDGVLGPLFTDPRAFEGAERVPAVMPAGSLLFFSPHTVHGSEPNESGLRRRALVLTYQPADHPMFKIPATRNAGIDSGAA